jgi:MFS family permease
MRGTPEVVSVREALAQGLAHDVANEGIRRAVLFSSLSGMLGIQAFQTLAPLFVADHLRSGGGAYGTFMACWGGGALAGAWAGTVGAHATHHSRLTSGSLGLGAALVGVALTAAPITFVLAGVLGFAQILLVQTAMLVVLDSTSDGLRGRVMGLYVTAFQGTAPLGSVMAGVAAQLLGVQLAMAASGVLLVCLIGVSALALRLTGRTASDPAPATDP